MWDNTYLKYDSDFYYTMLLHVCEKNSKNLLFMNLILLSNFLLLKT